jgi:hypothetical protein
LALYPGRRALSALLALGWYVSRFQRFCRFAASGMVVGGDAFQQRAFAL